MEDTAVCQTPNRISVVQTNGKRGLWRKRARNEWMNWGGQKGVRWLKVSRGWGWICHREDSCGQTVVRRPRRQLEGLPLAPLERPQARWRYFLNGGKQCMTLLSRETLPKARRWQAIIIYTQPQRSILLVSRLDFPMEGETVHTGAKKLRLQRRVWSIEYNTSQARTNMQVIMPSVNGLLLDRGSKNARRGSSKRPW